MTAPIAATTSEAPSVIPRVVNATLFVTVSKNALGP